MPGWRDGWSHAWLQRGPLVVDITAYQFDEVDAPVIVSEDSRWRSAGEVENVADFMIYDLHTKASLARAYQLLCSQLPAHLQPPVA